MKEDEELTIFCYDPATGQPIKVSNIEFREPAFIAVHETDANGARTIILSHYSIQHVAKIHKVEGKGKRSPIGFSLNPSDPPKLN